MVIPRYISHGRRYKMHIVCCMKMSIKSFDDLMQQIIWNFMKLEHLRVVLTQAVLKSMSQRVGSDIEQLLNWMMNFWIDSKSIKIDFIQFKSRSISDPTLSDIDFKNEIAWIWTTLNGFYELTFGLSQIICLAPLVFKEPDFSRNNGLSRCETKN